MGTAYPHDVLADAEYGLPDVQRHGGYRTVLGVPMLREGDFIGVITWAKTRVEPFTDKQIELVTSFADQATIAIEHVRLFQELEARTRELTRSVEELRALAEVGEAVGSTLDLQKVLTPIVARAAQLSGSDGGIIYEFDEGTQAFHVRTTHHIIDEHLEAVRATPIRLGEGAIGWAGATRTTVQVADILDEREPVAPQSRNIMADLGFRSLLAIPLLREERLVGGLVVWREERGHFPAWQGFHLLVHGADPGRGADGAGAERIHPMSRRILVIDDHEDNRRILHDLQASAGYEVVASATGERPRPRRYSRPQPRPHATSSSPTSTATRRPAVSRAIRRSATSP